LTPTNFAGSIAGIKRLEKGDTCMALTDIFVKSVKPLDKPKKYKSSEGMYLYVLPSGTKSWRFDYRFQGKNYTLTFGTYPLVTVKEARDKRFEAKRILKSGIDPRAQKKAVEEAIISETKNTFEVVAKEWIGGKKEVIAESYSSRLWGRVEKELFPFLANRQISEITAPEFLEVLRKTEARGAVDTAHRCLQYRCLQYCGQIFRYAIMTTAITIIIMITITIIKITTIKNYAIPFYYNNIFIKLKKLKKSCACMAFNFEKVKTTVKIYSDEVRQIMPVSKVFLYGSYAKGNATEHSDVDVFFSY
jgi:hypothetical protein